MVRELEPAEALAPPAGVELAAVQVGRDAAALHALDGESFAGSADYVAMSFETFRAGHLEGHDFAPELSCVAWAGEELAGFLLARRWLSERAGYVDVLAVAPAHQGRGIGTALLTRAFADFAAAGLREAQLGVASSNPRALRLYERLGMRPRFREDTYVQEVQR